MFLKNNKIKHLFVTPENQYTKKRQIKPKAIAIVIIVILTIFLILGSFFEETQKEPKRQTTTYLDKLPTPQASATLPYKEPEYEEIIASDIPKSSRAKVSRVKSFNREALIGSKQAVVLLGNIVANSKDFVPIRAKVITSNSPKDYGLDFHLKKGTLLLGRGQVDKTSERLHISFHSLLIDGKRHSIQAKAFMADGSFGLTGKYNSGELKKYGYRFGGNFIGGVSQGLKQKTVTQSGAVLEVANLGNALLNGLSLSFLDYAKDKSRKNEKTQAKVFLKDKFKFIAYFEN